MAPTDPPAGAGGPAGQELVPEAGGGVDLQPDVERIHRAIRREPRDPIEGREPAPWIFVASIALALFWGGWYLGRYGGEFDRETHIAFAARQKGIAASAAAQASAATTDPVAAGKRVFAKNCEGCHQATGKGVPGAFPPLVGSEWVVGPPETVVRILLHGLQGPVQVAGATFNGAMPAWKDVLKDEEIAAVATYIRQWAPNSAPAVPVEQVAGLRTAQASRAAAWSAPELKTAEASGPAAAPAPAAAPRQP
jgi:mono/diheme cytochrome c family protein